MPYDRRRYRLRQSMDEAPSSKKLWGRVALYAVVLVVVLIFQDNLGDSAAGCFNAFGGKQ